MKILIHIKYKNIFVVIVDNKCIILFFILYAIYEIEIWGKAVTTYRYNNQNIEENCKTKSFLFCFKNIPNQSSKNIKC